MLVVRIFKALLLQMTAVEEEKDKDGATYWNSVRDVSDTSEHVQQRNLHSSKYDGQRLRSRVRRFLA